MLTLTLTACEEDDFSGIGLDMRIIGVKGTVRSASNLPVAGAAVFVISRRQSCSGEFEDQQQTITNSEGQYLSIVTGSRSADPRCVQVTAGLNAQSGHTERTGVVFRVRFPSDTIVIDVVIR